MGRDTSRIGGAGHHQRPYPQSPHDHHAAGHDARRDDGDYADSADHNRAVDDVAGDLADHHDDSPDTSDNHDPDHHHADHDSDDGRGRNDDYPDGDAVSL